MNVLRILLVLTLVGTVWLPAADLDVSGTDSTTKTYEIFGTITVKNGYVAESTADITLIAKDGIGFEANTTFQAGALLAARIEADAGNTAPTATVTAPTEGSEFTTLDTVLLTASVSDTTGSVTSVDFYDGATLIGAGVDQGDGTWDYSWVEPSAGSKSVTAKAKDEFDLEGTSAAVAFEVIALPLEANPDSYETDGSNQLDVTAPGVLDNDTAPNSNAKTAVLDEDVAHGTLTLNGDGSFNYVPDSGYTGIDTFTYHVDHDGNSSEATQVSLSVNVDLSDVEDSGLVINETFDEDAWDNDTNGYRAAYLGETRPGRVWQSASPGQGVPALEVGSSTTDRYLEPAGSTQALTVVTAADAPVTFYCLGEGKLGEGSTTASTDPSVLTVQADAQGEATVTLHAFTGHRIPVLVASPKASGQITFVIVPQ